MVAYAQGVSPIALLPGKRGWEAVRFSSLSYKPSQKGLRELLFLLN
jgi:hypothetical protein